MKQVNELASQQAERNTKLATEHQKTTKVNPCEVPKGEGEPKTRNPDGDGSQKILSKLRQMKSAIINDLQDRVNGKSSQAPTPDRGQFSYSGRGGSCQPKYARWGCQNCRGHGRGEECGHCFASGSSGHVARECPRSWNWGSRQGNGRRLFR